MLSDLLYWALEALSLSWLVAGRSATSRGRMLDFMVGDRFEKRVNRTPVMQGRVVAVAEQHDGQILTIEWDDGTRTTDRPEDVLRSAREIHPLAPRLDRSARH